MASKPFGGHGDVRQRFEPAGVLRRSDIGVRRKMGSPCLQGHHAGGRIGYEFNDDPIQVGFPFAEEIRIAFQDQMLTLLPLHEFEGAGADRLDIGRVLADFPLPVDMLGNDGQKEGMGGCQESRIGMLQFKNDNMRIGGVDFFHGPEHGDAEGMILAYRFQRKGDIRRGNRFAVVESGSLFQMEGIGFAVGGNLPFMGQVGSRLKFVRQIAPIPQKAGFPGAPWECPRQWPCSSAWVPDKPS